MRADRWERNTARHNTKRAAAAPLFAHAGLLELVTPAQRQVQMESRTATLERQLRAARERLERDGAHHARLLGALLEPESMEGLEAYRQRVLPASAEYSAGFWRNVWERLRTGEPLLPPQWVAPTPQEDAENRARVRELVALWQQVDAQHPELVRRVRTGDHKALAALTEARCRAEVRCLGSRPPAGPAERLRVKVGALCYEADAPGRGQPLRVPARCGGCGAEPVLVGAGLTGDEVRYQAHCTACLRVVGWVEFLDSI